MRKIALLLASALVAVASAQTTTTPPMGGWGAASTYNMLYSPDTEVTLNGRVIGAIETQAPTQGMTPVTTILVKSANGGTSTVDLGPSWYLNNLRTPVKVGDTVQVTGSKVELSGRSFIMARRVAKGSHTLYLRETNGFPLWVAARGPLAPTSPRQNTGIF